MVVLKWQPVVPPVRGQRILLDDQVGILKIIAMIPAHQAITPITMPVRVLTSLPRHSPVPKTAMTSIQAAGHAATSTVRWLRVQRA